MDKGDKQCDNPATMRYETLIRAGKHSLREYLPDFSIGVRDCPEHPEYPEHTHEFTELVVVSDGSGIGSIEGIELSLAAGDVFVIHPGETHAYKQTCHLHLSNVLFDSALLHRKGADVAHLPGYHALFMLEPALRKAGSFSRMRLQSGELLKAKVIIDELERELDEKSPGYRLISQSLLLLLVGKLSRWYTPSLIDGSNNLDRIAGAIAHMEAAFFDPHPIEALAREAGLSERTFYRIFEQAKGVSPNQYLATLRLSHVAELLVHSDMSITDIAFECGFQDSSYMARQFKRRMGLTPHQFRQSNRA